LTWAVVRIRGQVHLSQKVHDTLWMLHLTRANHCVFLPQNDAMKGMVQKVKDHVTWGEVSLEMVAKLLLKRGRAAGNGRINDDYVKANSKFKSVWDFAQALTKGEAKMTDVKGLKSVLRLHPPKGGFRGIKRSFRDFGDLGYRGDAVNRLLDRMIFEEAN